MANTPRQDRDRALQPYADGSWGVDYYDRGRRVRRKIGTKTEARRYYQEIVRRKAHGEVLPGNEPPRVTISERLLQLAEEHRDRNTRRDARKWAEELEGLLPEEFTPAGLRAWIRLQEEAGYSPSSIHRMLAPLRNVYLDGIRDKVFPADCSPFGGRVKLPRVNPTREGYLEPAQELALYAQLADWWRYVEFAILTGMRWGNQAALRRGDVELDRGLVYLPRTKSGKRKWVPLTSRGVELVREQLASHSSPWLWPTQTGAQLHHSNFAKRVWRPALAAAGIEGFRWHDLRHTHASRIVQAGGSLYEVQQALGQADPRTSQRYSHLGDSLRGRLEEVEGRAWEAIVDEIMRWFRK